MAHPGDAMKTQPQPDLAQLLSGYLKRQADAHALGLATFDLPGEVVPYEAGPVQPIDPCLAWLEASAAARFFVANVPAQSWKAPPAWPALVAGHEPTVALALCVGNFPQLVRDLHPLLQTANLTDLRPGNTRPVPVPGLSEWAGRMGEKKSFPQALLAVGALRLAKQFDQASELLTRCAADVPAAWRSAWENEKAALAWQRGNGEAARALWDAQPASVPVLFNRGMAALFLGEPAEARAALTQAVGELPESSAWHHLGRLYLTLAEARE